MQRLSDHKLITCLLPHHLGLSVLKDLSKEKGIIMANKSNARGSSYTTNFSWIEMEILEVVVEKDQADEIYTYLYDKAEIGTPHGGMIFQHALSRTSGYSLPEDLGRGIDHPDRKNI